jgi:hypothetical protein
MWKKDSHRLQIVNLVVWALALIPTLFIFIFQLNDQALRLWGLWLYILAAVGIVIFEIILMRTDPIKAE